MTVRKGPAGIFVNEGAASARSPRVQSAVALTRRALDADLHVTATRVPDELRAFMEERLDGYQTVVVAGGDGSLGVAFNAVAGRDLTLGYIPAGFGNATSHLLRLPRHPAALAGLLASGEARSTDLVAVDDHLALFAGAGWDALVAGRYAQAGARRMLGWASAITSSIPDLLRRHLVRVEVDSQHAYAGPLTVLVASTTPYYGRGLLVNPGARPDRGQLTVRIYPGPLVRQAVESVRWLAHVRPSAPGRQATSVAVTSTDGRPIPVQADGDLVGEAVSWSFQVRVAAVRLIGKW
jgi:diacylglycerol kinase family enzyme